MFELEEVKNIQMVTAIVYYHFPPIPTVPAKSLIDNERNGFHVVEGFRGSTTQQILIPTRFMKSLYPQLFPVYFGPNIRSGLHYNIIH